MTDSGVHAGAGRPVSRRVVLDLGKGTLAIALVSLAGCSSGSAGGSGSAGNGGSAGSSVAAASPSSAASSAAASSAAAPSAAASPADASAGSSGGSSGGLAWKRVNLDFVSAYVLVRGNEAAVVDTGVGGSANAIGQVLTDAGPGWAGVRHVVLTHKHPDHAGSIGDVLSRAASATGYVGEADLAQVQATGLNPLKDGDEVFGLQVIATPGHTAGHISVFDPGSGLLVAGDALNNTGGLTGANPQFSEDMTTAAQSVKKLAALPVKTLLFGHGEPLETGAAAALKKLAGL